jgi:predicted signal transduction protein with EAL and GGDEF domain
LPTAAVAAEQIRTAFAGAADVLDGMRVASTVSIGCAASDDIDCDLNGLFHRADGALYAAKNGGRNRVELISMHAAIDETATLLRPVTPAATARIAPVLEKRWRTRRYRSARWSETGGSRPRRGGPTLS